MAQRRGPRGGLRYGDLCTQSGTVTSACYNEAYGNMVTINHANGYSSLYGHMTNYIVSVGDYVTQGQTIGYVGSTRLVDPAHIYTSRSTTTART